MRRSLGKGLAQLLGESSEIQANEIAVADITPNPDQPRRFFDQDALEELAESLKSVGLMQPIVVRPVSEGKYEIIAGERRWRAAQIAGLTSVPVIVRAATDEQTLQMALIENVQRQDISPIEAAMAYKQLVEDFDLTQEDVAKKVGKSRVAVANALRLLRLPEEILEALGTGLITEGHARALLQCSSDKQLKDLFFKIVDEGLSVRAAEQLARTPEKAVATPRPVTRVVSKSSGGTNDPNWQALADGLSTYFGAPVALKRNEVGGEMILNFYSDEDLERVLEILGITL